MQQSFKINNYFYKNITVLFQFGFYSSVLLISFSQGVIYSILLLKKAVQTENKSNYWLSLFIFLCCLYIAPWMLGFAGWYDNQPYRDFLFYMPFQHLFFLGPIIFFYTQSLLNPSFKFSKTEAIHLLPGILYLLYIVSIWIYDTFIFGDYYFYADGLDKDFEDWYQKLGLLSMIAYFIMSIRYYNVYKKLMYQVVSYADSILFQWIKNYLIAFLVMLLLPILFDIIRYFYPEMNSYQGSWWFFLFFSIVMYYIAITGYSNPTNAVIPFKVSLFDKQPILLLDENNTENVESVIDIAYETFVARNYLNDYTMPILHTFDFTNFQNQSKKVFPEEWTFLSLHCNVNEDRDGPVLTAFKERQVFITIILLLCQSNFCLLPHWCLILSTAMYGWGTRDTLGHVSSFIGTTVS